jgi:hypothetical protein
VIFMDVYSLGIGVLAGEPEYAPDRIFRRLEATTEVDAIKEVELSIDFTQRIDPKGFGFNGTLLFVSEAGYLGTALRGAPRLFLLKGETVDAPVVAMWLIGLSITRDQLPGDP